MINFVCAISLVCCIGCIAAAMRSGSVWDRFNRDDLTDLGSNWRRAWTRVDSSAGRIDFSMLRETRNNRQQLAYLQANSNAFYWSVRRGSNSMPTNNRFLRFVGVFGQVERKPESFFIRLVVPYWLLAGLFAIAPLVCWTVWSRQRRLGRFGSGMCMACGYDLRATPEQCPECGTFSRLAQSHCD